MLSVEGRKTHQRNRLPFCIILDKSARLDCRRDGRRGNKSTENTGVDLVVMDMMSRCQAHAWNGKERDPAATGPQE